MKKRIFFTEKVMPIIVILTIPAVILVSCIESPLEPVAPSYNIQLGIPIMDRSWETGDFQTGNTWQENGDGTFSYVNTYAIKKQSLDSITAHPEPDSDKTTLGRFTVNPFTTPATVYTALELGFTIGGPQTIPPSAFSTTGDMHDNSVQFDYVAVNGGRLTFTITNNLPIPIDFPDPIRLRNSWNIGGVTNNDEVAVFTIADTLLPGESAASIFDIAGRLIYGILAIDPFQIHTPGSSDTVTFSTSNNISFTIQSGSISADSANAIIPSQTILSEDASRFVVDDTITLREATFKRGNLRLEIDNHIDLNTETFLSINELIENSTNASFMKPKIFSGKDDRLDTLLSISDYTIRTDSTTAGTVLHYSARIRTINSHGVKKQVSKNDFIQAKVMASDTLYARSVTGNFKTQYRDVNSGTKAEYNLKDIDKSNFDSLMFKGLKVKLKFNITAGTNPPPTDYHNLTIVSKNTKWNQTVLFPLADGQLFTAGDQTVIELPQVQTDEFINSLISNYPDLPDSIFVRGNLVINPNYADHPENTYTIKDTSGIYPYVDIEVPSFVGILGGYVSEVKDINEIIPGDIARSVIDGTLNLMFTNGIPAQMTARIGFFGTDSTEQDTLSFGPLGPVAAAHISPIDSSADSPAPSNIRIGLTGEQVVKISNSDSVYIRLDMNTNNGTSNGAMVRLRSTDAVRVQASTKVRCTINKP